MGRLARVRSSKLPLLALTTVRSLTAADGAGLSGALALGNDGNFYCTAPVAGALLCQPVRSSRLLQAGR
jgi:hypothetical protein